MEPRPSISSSLDFSLPSSQLGRYAMQNVLGGALSNTPRNKLGPWLLARAGAGAVARFLCLT